MKTAYWGLGLLLTLPLGSVAAQSQAAPQDMSSSSNSLVEAARRTREERKDQAKPPRVWTNDTIPKAGDEISVVGPATASSNNSAATTDNSPASANAANANNVSAKTGGAGASIGDKRSALESQITNAKEKLATIKTDLDILQRTYTLDSQMYYGKPDYSSDKEGAAKLKDEQDQIAAKQQEMDDQQKKIDDLEAQQTKLGPSAGTEPASSNEPASSEESK
jgi:hypothetical protein